VFKNAQHRQRQSELNFPNDLGRFANMADRSAVDMEGAAMNQQHPAIYQSGQKVLLDGLYEAIAARVPTVSQLTSGEVFPNYDGRAVCWHQLQSQSYKSEYIEIPNKTVDESESIYGGTYA